MSYSKSHQIENSYSKNVFNNFDLVSLGHTNIGKETGLFLFYFVNFCIVSLFVNFWKLTSTENPEFLHCYPTPLKIANNCIFSCTFFKHP